MEPAKISFKKLKFTRFQNLVIFKIVFNHKIKWLHLLKSGKSVSKKDNLVSDFLLRASLNMSYQEIISLPDIASDKECEDYL